MRRLFLLIGCAVAIILIVDSAMHDPDVHPVVLRMIERVNDGFALVESQALVSASLPIELTADHV